MASLGSGANPPRLSDAERERALGVLRDGAVEGRISQDTFMRRTDAVLRARWQGDLYAVLHDLPSRKPRRRWFDGAVGKVSAFPGRLRRAWQAERLPELFLPAPGPYPLTIGRAPGSMLRLTHYTVSRAHAQLRHSGDGWKLRDLGSSNGTWVNSGRVTGSVAVGPGDQVRFGQVAFRLTLPQVPPPPSVPPSVPSSVPPPQG